MKPGSFLIPSLLLALIVTVLVVVSCNKNNSGKPTLSLESISTPVQVNDSMRVRFKFTGGGTISNGYLWSIRHRTNQLQATNQSGSDTVQFDLPSFSANTGEIYLSLPWQGYLNETATENDSDYFQFFVQSATDSTANSTSDTVTTKQIIIIFQ
jgi:hypothetical protein